MHKHHTRDQVSAMRRRSLTTAIALTLAFGFAGSALAQDATPSAPADAAAAPAQDQKKATPQELDVVTVTANKRQEIIR